MSEPARKKRKKKKCDAELPPCEQAQADGVPCTELGRDCEICEKAYPETRDPRETFPAQPGTDGSLPVSGA